MVLLQYSYILHGDITHMILCLQVPRLPPFLAYIKKKIGEAGNKPECLNYYISADCLTSQRITEVSQNLVSLHSLELLQKFARELGFSSEELLEKRLNSSMESLLHQLIFEWRCRNPVNSVRALAKILHSCGCYQEAIRLHRPNIRCIYIQLYIGDV